MKTIFVVRVIDKEKKTIGGYAQELDLPFVPTVGMRLCGGSGILWKTKDDSYINPRIEDIVYDIDEEAVFCLFEIDKLLAHAFWKEIKRENLHCSWELSRFELD